MRSGDFLVVWRKAWMGADKHEGATVDSDGLTLQSSAEFQASALEDSGPAWVDGCVRPRSVSMCSQ